MLKKMMTIVTMKKNYKETIINYAKAMYASEDGLKLGIFQGDSNHLLLFNYIEYLDIVEVKIMRGEVVEARFTIEARDNQYGR